MKEQMFVAVDNADTWVNAKRIELISPHVGPEGEAWCEIRLVSGLMLIARTPARDFLNRMTGVTWK